MALEKIKVDDKYLSHLATSQDDEPIWMLNLMKYRPEAIYADGRDTNLTGREADDLFQNEIAMSNGGGEIVFSGDVEEQRFGEQPRWDRVQLSRFESRQAFIDANLNPAFRSAHIHKEAGLERTLVAGCTERAMPAIPQGLQPDWKSVPYPSTEDDGAVMTVQLAYFVIANEHHDPYMRDSFYRTAADVSIPLGVRLSGWFDVEGTLVGDGREWNRARFNAFPSRAAFLASLTDRKRIEMERDKRDSMRRHSISLLVRPYMSTIDKFLKVDPVPAIQVS